MRRSIFNRVGLAAIAGCIAVGALALAGCGGGSDTTATEASGASGASGNAGAAPLSQDEFVSQMNSICKEANDKIEAVKAPASNQLSDVAATLAAEAPINAAALSQVEGITPPSDLQSKFDAFLSTIKSQTALQNQFLAAAKANDVNKANEIIANAKKLSGQSDAQAQAMGLTECSKDVSPQG